MHNSRQPFRDLTPAEEKMAVAAAYDLLDWWGYHPAVTRNGKWAQLAQILADEPAFDPFEHMRKFKRNPVPSVEKVQGNDWIFYRQCTQTRMRHQTVPTKT